MRVMLRACTRCGGDMVPESWDPRGTFVCLQCGNEVAAASLRSPVRRTGRPAAPRRDGNSGKAA